MICCLAVVSETVVSSGGYVSMSIESDEVVSGVAVAFGVTIL